MSTVQEIEQALEGLPRDEFLALVDRLRLRNADAWDAQIEADSASGKLDFLLDEVEREVAAGTTRPLREILDDKKVL